MTWLVAHMWLVLAGVGVIAAALGWSVRGMLVVNKLRSAVVDRDVARVELASAREEIEKLFRAQRNSLAPAPGRPEEAGASAEPLPTAQIARLTQEVATLTAALAAATVPADSPSAAAPAAEADTLVWRNRQLESRVSFLETELAAVEARPVPEPVAAAPEADAGAARQVWETSYLKTRVTALEAQLVEATRPAPAAPAPDPVVAEPKPLPDVPVGTGKSAEEELAALRWRNRFLEGRLAYFEGEGAQAPLASPKTAPPISETMLGELEAADALADADEGGASMDPAPERPPALTKGEAGAPDDLTVIGGIGPKIQDVLNSLGIYRYEQVAAWTPANIVWIDEQMSFSGRILREGWVEQAAVLVRGPADA